MIKRVVVAGLLYLFVCSVSVASAAIIISGDGEKWTSTLAAVCTQVGSVPTCGGTTVSIDRHPAWMNDTLTNPVAEWVSYADTGYGGAVLAPQNGTAANPTGHAQIMEIAETVTGAAGDTLAVRFWADDTLDIYFNGVLKKAAEFGQDTCANVPIGCQPGEYWDLTTTLTGGTDTIRIIAYQVGSGTDTTNNPFGLLYSGRYCRGPQFVDRAGARQPHAARCRCDRRGPAACPLPGSFIPPKPALTGNRTTPRLTLVVNDQVGPAVALLSLFPARSNLVAPSPFPVFLSA